jgi:hypothetical protein
VLSEKRKTAAARIGKSGSGRMKWNEIGNPSTQGIGLKTQEGAGKVYDTKTREKENCRG